MTGTMSADVLVATVLLLVGGWHTLHDKIRSKDTHGGDTDARLCGSVGGAKAGEDDGGGAAHGTEEGLYKVSLVLSE